MTISWPIEAVPTPSFVVEEQLLRNNLEQLRQIKNATGCKILLAQKAFSMYAYYPLMAEYLDGTTASGIYEARLGSEEFGKETHVYSPAFRADEITELLDVADHFVFNSLTQWNTYKDEVLKADKICGLRINPQISTQDGPDIYDPCAPGSRLGITLEALKTADLRGISGLHFHTLCEQDADALAITLAKVEADFGEYLHQMDWINFGGGHHITRPGYDTKLLCQLITHIKDTYHVQVYLEPGEAVALNAGYLVASVLDITTNGSIQNAILDTSATCHMPDVLEMPYRPHVLGSSLPNEASYTYRFGGPTCLAGDIIGDYAFDQPLKIGDRVVFCDMAIYSMVKTNTFNGMPLASLYACDLKNHLTCIKTFGYDEFKRRLS
ncbi:carboxynorspermidine decarboxylase [uncultured Enterococcus sp.]|uniref:carboxynorspermidine decarboxylase n=1 Tax=uncultured Enterococcus sp. TaxID=167972 RepID=UPI0025E44183|nr:carboxynorspermidine decarboxylase [uncultured Enterococcus sp.]